MDNKALFKLSYGLYVLTACEHGRSNGCIINTTMQITSGPQLSGVIAVNKQNFTHDMIMSSKKFNVSVLATNTPFAVFERFGFQSGKNTDKFVGLDDVATSKNGLAYLPGCSNAYLSFEVTDSIDFGTHTMFKANIVDGETLNQTESVTYAYYHKHIKPQPAPVPPSGYVCNICGYVYEGEPLPTDFICPLCKHGASDFTKKG